ncbi:MAG: GAF domain-containing protein, partial [Chloroflexota bacterium]
RSEQERRQVASTLIDVGRTVASSLHRDEVLQRILEQLQRIIDYDGASIMLSDPTAVTVDEQMTLTIAASRGENSIPVGATVTFGAESYAMQVYQSREPVIQADVQENDAWEDFHTDGDMPNQSSTGQVRSWMGVPLLVGERIIGYIFLNKFQPDYYTEQAAETAFALAQQAAVAVENARLFESEQERRKIANTLIDVGRAVAASLDRDWVLNQILDQMRRVIAYDGATIMLQQPGYTEPTQMVVSAARGDINARPGSVMHFNDDSLNMRVYRELQPLVLSDAQGHPGFNGEVDNLGYVEDKTRAWICVPMLVQDRFVGFISLDKFEPNFYTERDAETAFALARQAAVAVENARLFESEQERRQVADT